MSKTTKQAKQTKVKNEAPIKRITIDEVLKAIQNKNKEPLEIKAGNLLKIELNRETVQLSELINIAKELDTEKESGSFETVNKFSNFLKKNLVKLYFNELFQDEKEDFKEVNDKDGAFSLIDSFLKSPVDFVNLMHATFLQLQVNGSDLNSILSKKQKSM